MEIKSLNEKMRELREKNGYSLEKLAEKIPVSKQGYHMWEQGIRGWKLDVLSKLSKILDFTLTIKDDVISISENKTIKEKEGKYKMREIVKENINLNKIIKLGDKYDIVELYTVKENIDIEEKEVKDFSLVFKSKEYAEKSIGKKDLVPVYAIFSEPMDFLYKNPFINIKDVYAFYYYLLAPELDEDRTVYINKEKNIKISKRFLIPGISIDEKGNQQFSITIAKNKRIELQYEEVKYNTEANIDEDNKYIRISFEEIENEEDIKLRQLKEKLLTEYDKNNIEKVNEINKEINKIQDNTCNNSNYGEFAILPDNEDGTNNKMIVSNTFIQTNEGLAIYRVTDLDGNIIEGINNICFEFPYELLK